MRTTHGLLVSLLVVATTSLGFAQRRSKVYVKDVEFALKQLEKDCRGFFKLKKIDWRAVSKEFLAEAKKVDNDSQHLVLLTRLLARLEDGHAGVRRTAKSKDVRWPEEPERTGPGMFWCRSGKKILIKNVWSSAKSSGIEPGMTVLQVDGTPVDAWLDKRIEELRDTHSFSTDQQAFFYACHWGLADAKGTRRKLSVKDVKGRKRKRTITYTRANPVPWGPFAFPEGLEGDKDVSYGKTKDGFGYIHLRKCKSSLPEQIDKALAGIGEVPGMILDFRANGGGGFDHAAMFGRFVPSGKTWRHNKGRFESAGPRQYAGPIVVIVDGNTRSAGETASGFLKEFGRAYMIGESPTAGMSSSKETVALPSGLFDLYVSVRSNMRDFNKGRGIEGIGVVPHEVVEYEAKDLANGVDTLIARATELLQKFPRKKVPYDPKKFGWKPPKHR